MFEKIKVNGDKIIAHDKIKAKLGLTDKSNHSVFYLEGGTFKTPTTNLDNFNEIMCEIESTCKRSIKNKLLRGNTFSTNFLMNFDVCSDRMKKGKNTYLSFQYHFKQKNDQNISIVTLKKMYEPFFLDLLNDIEHQLTDYKIKTSKTRKN